MNSPEYRRQLCIEASRVAAERWKAVPYEQRIAGRTERMPSGCLEWRGAVGRNGYGKLVFRGRVTSAHRVAYELAHGPIPQGQLVLHRCDNRVCLEPAHLYLGDHAQNMRDMDERGRRARGRAAGGKLTPEEVIAIRNALATGAVGRHLAKQYGVSTAQISLIKNHKQWRLV